MKKLLCIVIAIVLIAKSVFCAGARGYAYSNPDFQYLDETLTIKDNQVYICADGITENYCWGVYLKTEDGNSGKTDVYLGKDCLSKPQILSVDSDIAYSVWEKGNLGSSGSAIHYKFNTTGGTYKKVRYKLSNIDRFNEDGSYTDRGIDYYFAEDQHIDGGTYSGSMIVVSGGIISIVAPDKDGYIEFYITTDIGVIAVLHIAFDYKYENVSGICGGFGVEIGDFTKGITNDDIEIRIAHATLIQRYLAKQHEFVGLENYRADVNCDGKIDIFDATLIQLYLAKVE